MHLHSISFVLGLVVLKSAHPLEKLFSKIGKQTRKSNTSNTILQRHLFFVNIPRASFAAEFFFYEGTRNSPHEMFLWSETGQRKSLTSLQPLARLSDCVSLKKKDAYFLRGKLSWRNARRSVISRNTRAILRTKVLPRCQIFYSLTCLVLPSNYFSTLAA